MRSKLQRFGLSLGKVLLILSLSSCTVWEAIPPFPEDKEVPLLDRVSTTPGYDVLGLPKYCETFLKAPPLPGVSVLLASFGNPLPCLERRIAKGGITLVQVDVRDATCFRNRVCPQGTPPLTDWNFLASQVRKVAALSRKYPGIQWDVSPWLEHDIKDEATVRKACNVVVSNCPSCRCINSPFSGARPREIPLELHGTKVKAFSISGDGASSFDGDNLAGDGNNFTHSSAGTFSSFAWWNELNLRCTGEENFTPIPRRTARPELWQFQAAHRIFTSSESPYPPAPSVCRTVRRINRSRGEINKPLAERYCNGQANQNDSRGNKPLLILRRSGRPGDTASVYRSDGRRVGSFRYYGPFSSPGLHRWYMGNSSGQNAWELYQALGTEWGFVHFGGGECLMFNALRREGSYR